MTTPLVSISYDDPLTVRRDSLGRVLKQVETIEGVQRTTVFCIRSGNRVVTKHGLQAQVRVHGRANSEAGARGARRVGETC